MCVFSLCFSESPQPVLLELYRNPKESEQKGNVPQTSNEASSLQKHQQIPPRASPLVLELKNTSEVELKAIPEQQPVTVHESQTSADQSSPTSLDSSVPTHVPDTAARPALETEANENWEKVNKKPEGHFRTKCSSPRDTWVPGEARSRRLSCPVVQNEPVVPSGRSERSFSVPRIFIHRPDEAASSPEEISGHCITDTNTDTEAGVGEEVTDAEEDPELSNLQTVQPPVSLLSTHADEEQPPTQSQEVPVDSTAVKLTKTAIQMASHASGEVKHGNWEIDRWRGAELEEEVLDTGRITDSELPKHDAPPTSADKNNAGGSTALESSLAKNTTSHRIPRSRSQGHIPSGCRTNLEEAHFLDGLPGFRTAPFEDPVLHQKGRPDTPIDEGALRRYGSSCRLTPCAPAQPAPRRHQYGKFVAKRLTKFERSTENGRSSDSENQPGQIFQWNRSLNNRSVPQKSGHTNCLKNSAADLTLAELKSKNTVDVGHAIDAVEESFQDITDEKQYFHRTECKKGSAEDTKASVTRIEGVKAHEPGQEFVSNSNLLLDQSSESVPHYENLQHCELGQEVVEPRRYNLTMAAVGCLEEENEPFLEYQTPPDGSSRRQSLQGCSSPEHKGIPNKSVTAATSQDDGGSSSAFSDIPFNRIHSDTGKPVTPTTMVDPFRTKDSSVLNTTVVCDKGSGRGIDWSPEQSLTPRSTTSHTDTDSEDSDEEDELHDWVVQVRWGVHPHADWHNLVTCLMGTPCRRGVYAAVDKASKQLLYNYERQSSAILLVGFSGTDCVYLFSE